MPHVLGVLRFHGCDDHHLLTLGWVKNLPLSALQCPTPDKVKDERMRGIRTSWFEEHVPIIIKVPARCDLDPLLGIQELEELFPQVRSSIGRLTLKAIVLDPTLLACSYWLFGGFSTS